MWAHREGRDPSMVTGRPTTPRDLWVIFESNKAKARQDRRKRKRGGR